MAWKKFYIPFAFLKQMIEILSILKFQGNNQKSMTRVCFTHCIVDIICSEFHISKSSQVFDPLRSLELLDYQRLDE